MKTGDLVINCKLPILCFPGIITSFDLDGEHFYLSFLGNAPTKRVMADYETFTPWHMRKRGIQNAL